MLCWSCMWSTYFWPIVYDCVDMQQYAFISIMESTNGFALAEANEGSRSLSLEFLVGSCPGGQS